MKSAAHGARCKDTWLQQKSRLSVESWGSPGWGGRQSSPSALSKKSLEMYMKRNMTRLNRKSNPYQPFWLVVAAVVETVRFVARILSSRCVSQQTKSLNLIKI